ncbi:MAG TPA: hypothetical protein VGO50_08110 [Pyrinomonadaceae bacterium]|jgi:hypothetical protein|nr:hypothetical protein [Pyrinomonadaceae bacterium]
MKSTLSILLLLIFALTVPAQMRNTRRPVPVRPVSIKTVTKPAAPAPEAGAQLPIKRVILYSNGVAYIERRGMVSGDARIDLSFKQSQVDDVLKSMVVLDLGQGRIGAVSYNSSAPPSAKMNEIPFGVDSDTESGGGLAGVLKQLQGARVLVTSTKGPATGSILTVEKRILKTDKTESEVYALVIASETGEISSFDLSDVRSVKLLDSDTRRDVNEFANATASARRRDAKTITVTSEGSGQREMVVSYTIAAPIWKTTYRVVLDNEGKPFFQGWAIVDNVSDEDWTAVKLSLVSGTPISFIQPIQKPMYRYRPVIPIPADLNLDPQIYEEGESAGVGMGRGSGTAGGVVNVTNSADVSAARISAQQINSLPISGAQNNYMNSMNSAPGATAETTVSEALSNNRSGVETAATGEEIGDLFEYRIDQPITVNRDRSALIPIVQTKMTGERISIYNEATRRDRPMSGLLLQNTTTLTLENGSLTVLDRDAYAGEALMERLKPKEQRLISFALDLGTLVTIKDEEVRAPAKLIKAVNGVLQVHYFQSDRKIYKLSNQTDRQKIVYIEHPVRGGWELSEDTTAPALTTQKYYRFRIVLEPFAKAELPVTERQGLVDSYQIGNLSKTDLELFVQRKYISAETRAALEKFINLRSQIHQIDARLEAFEAEEEKISDDQKRLRENIEALAKTPEAKTLIARYIAKANEQESRLEAIDKERKMLEQQKQTLENELGVEILKFSL